MHLPLSNRLQACADFVRPGDRVADVGCDHGYLGIHLLLENIAEAVTASDVNPAPLESAKRNAQKYGVADRMRFFLSDGVRDIPRDFTCLICAGMGADTMISILDAAPWLKNEGYHLILQCQSKRPALRKYLYEQGYVIVRETLSQDGKFIYPVMEVVYAPGRPLTPGGCYITPALLESRSPLLQAFYRQVVENLQTTIAGLTRTGGEKLNAYRAIVEELRCMEDTVYGNRR